jgi:hypothetical protein
MKDYRIICKHVAQMKDVDVDFGDLTVIVGPQASGKSIFLQLFKLLFDAGHINQALRKAGFHWQGDAEKYFSLYLGEGMGNIFSNDTAFMLNNTPIDIMAKTRAKKGTESVYYIPAQRVLSLRNGWPRPFTDYDSGDPFVVRHFSESIRRLMEAGLGVGKGAIFPQPGRMKKNLRDALDQGVFAGSRLTLDTQGLQKRVVLDTGKNRLPFMVWSAGQREFIPLLLGLYRLLPSSKARKVKDIDWVILEEPEAGLHPKAISAILLSVLELLARGYRIIISTHSPHILDLVWGLNVLAENRASPEKVLQLLGLSKSSAMNRVAGETMKKSRKVYFFDRTDQGVKSFDISSLDPGSIKPEESGWGGLTDFSGRVSEVVSQVMGEKE